MDLKEQIIKEYLEQYLSVNCFCKIHPANTKVIKKL